VNRYRALIAGAWALAALGALASIAAWATAVPSVPREGRKAYASTGSPTRQDTVGLASMAATIRDRDPFRSDRKPANARFNPWQAVAAPGVIPHPAPVRPPLALVGIVGGPPWTALVEGIPGREAGVLLRVGEEAGGVRLVDIRGDQAHLSGFDTTWVLTPRRTWR